MGPSRERHIDYDLTRALQRVTLTDAHNPGERMANGLLNPQTFKYSVQVAIGELNPVGYSSSVLNYGHTKSGEVPIEFYFSTQLSQRVSGFQELTYYSNWIGAFCFPKKMGQAPPVMLCIWPKVINITLVVASYEADIVRFHLKNLQPAAIRVKILARELRITHRTAADFRKDGLKVADPLVSSGGGGGRPTKGTGAPLLFEGSNRKVG